MGLVEQPQTIHATYDFQKWFKPYQYFVQTDADGNFTIPNVLPGNKYTLWAYGPGAAGTFLSQPQQGANPPLECDVPAHPFAVKVAAGATQQLGTVTWTPLRVGPTVFELGYPNRKADKYRHGEDYPFPDDAPKLGFPTAIWGPQMAFNFEFPEGLTYTVGKNRWSTDWNYILPSLPDTNGAYQPCKGNLVFDLPAAPPAGATASLYIAAAGYDGDQRFPKNQVSISVNDKDLGTAPGTRGAPAPLTPTGYFPAYSDDSSIHCGVHGPFSDERLYFPASLLRAGQNTITIHVNGTGLTDYLMVDYLRLELPGYVPPAPARVTAYAGNNAVLVTWPVVPGATSYDVLRSTNPISGYVPVAAGKAGLVCGGDMLNMTYADATAANGAAYYYKVVSKNPQGQSGTSPASAGAIPAATINGGVPPAPAKLQVSSSGHHQVALSWTPHQRRELLPGFTEHITWQRRGQLLPAPYDPAQRSGEWNQFYGHHPDRWEKIPLLCAGYGSRGHQRAFAAGRCSADAAAARVGPAVAGRAMDQDAPGDWHHPQMGTRGGGHRLCHLSLQPGRTLCLAGQLRHPSARNDLDRREQGEKADRKEGGRTHGPIEGLLLPGDGGQRGRGFSVSGGSCRRR